MKTGHVIIGFLLISALLCAGCNVNLKNHTPSQIPVHYPSIQPSQCLYPDSTPHEYQQACLAYKHKFLLEVKPDLLVSSVKPFVIINGTEYPMVDESGPSGKGLYSFTLPNCEREKFEYSFRVSYGVAGLFGTSKFLKDLQDRPFKATIVKSPPPFSGAGQFAWWVEYAPSNWGAEEVHIYANEDGSPKRTTFHIQCVSPTPIRVTNVSLDPRTEAKKFAISKKPDSGVFNCQDATSFDIVWNPVSPDFEDVAYILVQMDVGQGRYDAFFILLKTFPYEGPI